MIKGLLLDFGSVISKSLFERHRITEEALGLKKGTLTWQSSIIKDLVQHSANNP